MSAADHESESVVISQVEVRSGPVELKSTGTGKIMAWPSLKRSTNIALLIALLFGLVIDLTGYISLDQYGCRPVFGEVAPDIPCDPNGIYFTPCKGPEKANCNDGLAYIAENKIWADHFGTDTGIFVVQIVEILAQLVRAAFFHVVMFIAYVVSQPHQLDALVAIFGLRAAGSIWRWLKRAGGADQASTDPLDVLRAQRGDANAGPAKRDRIDAALRGKSSISEPRFKD